MTNDLDRNLAIIIPPASEPITLDDAKLQCRVNVDLDDDLITDLIVTAREKVETFTRRTIMPTTYERRISDFNAIFNPVIDNNWYDGWSSNDPRRHDRRRRIWLPKPPLIEVLFVKYIDVSGNEQTLDPSMYAVESGGLGQGFLTPIPGSPFPTAQKNSAFRIQFQAGFETVANPDYQPPTIVVDGVTVTNPDYDPTQPVYLAYPPACARTAIKLLVAHLYRNRLATSTTTLTEIPFGIKSILSPLIWGSYT